MCLRERDGVCKKSWEIREFVCGWGRGEGNIDGVCVNDAICVKERPILYIYVCACG